MTHGVISYRIYFMTIRAPQKPVGSQSRRARQRGMSLIELMVGVALGLLTIAVAIGALMVSRGVSGTVTDASQLQQQASYAFRVIGQQIRQAGSMRLNLAANKPANEDFVAEDVVAFAPNPEIFSVTPGTSPKTPAVKGLDSPATGEYRLALAYQNYEEKSFLDSVEKISSFRDCLGAAPSADIIQSQFVLKDDKNELHCAGSGGGSQAIVTNVGDFQVRYLTQSNAATGSPTIQYASAAQVPQHAESGKTDWGSVFGVEVCLVLYGDESISMPDGSKYTGCELDSSGKPVEINMSSTGKLPDNRKNRLHMAFRSVYQLRSQGRAS